MVSFIVYLTLGVVLVIAMANFWKVSGFLNSQVLKLRAFQARLVLNKTLAGQIGAAAISSILDGLIVVFLGIILVFTFIPQIEAHSSTANITNPTTKTFGNLAGWILSVLAIIGLIYVGLRLFLKHGKRG